MVNYVRDHVVSLACLRYGLPAHEGRGVDALPAEVREMFATTIVRGLDRSELSRALAHVVAALLDEAGRIDSDLASRLSEPARELVRTAVSAADEHMKEPGK